METKIGANCPVSGVKVNEKVIRIIAFFVCIVAGAAAYFQAPALCFFLAIDFVLRAFTSGEHSILKITSLYIATALNFKNKPVDAAPKKFAASLGFLFSLSAGVLQLAGLYTTADIVISLLIVCALLESLFSICIGCIVYSWLQKFAYAE